MTPVSGSGKRRSRCPRRPCRTIAPSKRPPRVFCSTCARARAAGGRGPKTAGGGGAEAQIESETTVGRVASRRVDVAVPALATKETKATAAQTLPPSPAGATSANAVMARPRTRVATTNRTRKIKRATVSLSVPWPPRQRSATIPTTGGRAEEPPGTRWPTGTFVKVTATRTATTTTVTYSNGLPRSWPLT